MLGCSGRIAEKVYTVAQIIGKLSDGLHRILRFTVLVLPVHAGYHVSHLARILAVNANTRIGRAKSGMQPVEE